VLDTVVPHAKAYKEAATLRIPVQPARTSARRRHAKRMRSDAQLAWELIPSLQGVHADGAVAEERSV